MSLIILISLDNGNTMHICCKKLLSCSSLLLIFIFAASVCLAETTQADIQAIFNKPLYNQSKWSLRVLDADTNKIIIDYNSNDQLYIASVRKVFVVGEYMQALGPYHQTVTTVHYDGSIKRGVLKGNLVLLASGDIVMGGRTLPNGKLAFTTIDHNNASDVGNAELVSTDPLAGYKSLVKQIKNSGIKKISGDIIIDDRLFEPFNFRDQFYVTPIFVNDDVIDIKINPGEISEPAQIDWQPKSAAFNVINHSSMSQAGQAYTLALKPFIPECFGKTDCHGEVINHLPLGYVPPFTKKYPIIQTFRISKPSNYARTIFIEALSNAGVDVSAVTLVKDNPVDLLKDPKRYTEHNKLAELKSLSYSEYAKLIFKVSYNLGSDTTLMLYGLSQGVRTMADSLRIEKNILKRKYGISPDTYHFPDGSGGGLTTATAKTVTDWLSIMYKSKSYQAFRDAMPLLGYDGSFKFSNQFKADATLKGAEKNVSGKSGTMIEVKGSHFIVKGQAFAGYINTRNHHHLLYHVVVNNVDIPSVEDSLDIFEDQGTITAILWRDY